MNSESLPVQPRRKWPVVSNRLFPAATIACAEPNIFEAPADLVVERVEELREQLPQNVRGRITLAVGAVAQEQHRYVVLGTSEKYGYLREGVRPRISEIVVSCTVSAHAEITVIAYTLQSSWVLLLIGATRPICEDCYDGLSEVGAEAVTPLKV